MYQRSVFGPSSRPALTCAACKKSDSACEIAALPDLSADVKCSRCWRLRQPCSFSEMDKSLFLPYVARAEPKVPHLPLDISDSPLAPSIIEQYTRAVQPPALGYGTPLQETALEPRMFRVMFESYFLTFLELHGSFDWSKPLEVMRELLRYQTVEKPSTDPSPLPEDRSLYTILSLEQIKELLEIFTLRFEPWLNISLPKDSRTEVQQIVMCSVASRHLSPPFTTSTSLRLQKLMDATITNLVCTAPASMEVVEALLILALWPPIGPVDNGTRDSRALLVTATSIASNLRLSEASATLLDLKNSGASEARLVDLRNKARLWNALANAESMLCLGTGRDPLTSRSPTDIDFIPPSTLSPETLTECRDARLRFLGEMFNAVEAAGKLRLSGPSDLNDWYDANVKLMGTMDRVRRLMLPLEVVTDHEQFFFHMLMLVLHSCQVQLVYHAIHLARNVFNPPTAPNPFWFATARPHGINMNVWGRDTLSVSGAILRVVLQTDPVKLNSCPDVIFAMLAFAADLLCATRYFLWHMQLPDLQLHRSITGKLLKRVAAHLQASATSDAHPAAACARFIMTMVHKTEEIVKSAAFGGVQGGIGVAPQIHSPNVNDKQSQFWTQLLGSI